MTVILASPSLWACPGSVEEALRVAMGTSDGIKDAKLARKGTEESRLQAIANLRPKISLEASRLHTSTNTLAVDPIGASKSLTLRQAVWDPSFYQVDVEDFKIASAQAQEGMARDALLMCAGTSMLALDLATKRLEISQQIGASLEKVAGDLEELLAAGEGSPGLVADIQQDLQASDDQRDADASTIEAAKARLQTLLGCVPAIHVSEFIRPPIPESKLAHEITALESTLGAVTASIRKARAQHLPTFSLVAKASRHDTNDLYTDEDSHYYGVEVSVPVYEGGRTESQVRQQRLRSEQLSTRIAGKQKELAEKDSQLRSSIERIHARLMRASSVIAANQRQLDALIERHQLNDTTSTDVERARVSLLRAELNHYQLREQLLKSHLDLAMTRGSLTIDYVSSVLESKNVSDYPPN